MIGAEIGGIIRAMETPVARHPQSLMKKIEALPADRIAEVEDFVDFIATREQDRAVTHAATMSSESAFANVWNNPEDDVYDAL